MYNPANPLKMISFAHVRVVVVDKNKKEKKMKACQLKIKI